MYKRQVNALDSNGFDRSTQEQFKAYATEPVDVILEESEDEGNQGKSSLSVMTTGLMAIGIMLSLALVLGLAIVLQRQRRDGVGAEVYDDYDYSGYEEPEPSPLSVPPPPPGMAPPLPPEGLPAGWTLEQWNYYGEEYLRRREQS